MRVLIEGSILSVVFLTLVLATLATNPRVWLQDYPKDIQRRAASQTYHEKKQFRIMASILGMMAMLPLVVSLIMDSNQLTFWHAFSHFYLVFTVVSLADLIVLDWIVFCIITPSFIVIPGTHGAKGYHNYGFHFVGFLRGAVILGVLSLVLAGLRITASLIQIRFLEV